MSQPLPVDTFNDAELESTETSNLPSAPTAAPATPEAPATPDAPETPATPDAPAASDAPPEPKKSYMLPKHRYDYQKQKRVEAEKRAEDLARRLAEVESRVAQQPAGPTPAQLAAERQQKIDSLYDQVEQLRLDGQKDEAVAMGRQIRQMEREAIRAELAAEQARPLDPVAVREEIRDEMRLEAVIDQVEAAHPFLAEGDPNYDPEVVGEVLDVYGALVSRGQPKHVAMSRAVAYVVGTLTSPATSAAPAAPADRRRPDLAKNLAAAKSQPPELGERGYNSDRAGPTKPVDVARMSIEEYERAFSRMDEDKFLV